MPSRVAREVAKRWGDPDTLALTAARGGAESPEARAVLVTYHAAGLLSALSRNNAVLGREPADALRRGLTRDASPSLAVFVAHALVLYAAHAAPNEASARWWRDFVREFAHTIPPSTDDIRALQQITAMYRAAEDPDQAFAVAFPTGLQIALLSGEQPTDDDRRTHEQVAGDFLVCETVRQVLLRIVREDKSGPLSRALPHVDLARHDLRRVAALRASWMTSLRLIKDGAGTRGG